jgi:hypothetical protein
MPPATLASTSIKNPLSGGDLVAVRKPLIEVGVDRAIVQIKGEL